VFYRNKQGAVKQGPYGGQSSVNYRDPRWGRWGQMPFCTEIEDYSLKDAFAWLYKAYVAYEAVYQ